MTTAAFVSPASFWKPDFLSPSLASSAWTEHAPFAFWLVDALRPRTIVELGTQTGLSYLALCEAVDRLGLAAKAYAVDTWEGDEQTGFYGEEVFQQLTARHDPRYASFSRLLRSTFDDAVAHFEDGSIDLLHIDGLHTYDAVRHDFETWRPKLRASAVVLLHDTNVREGAFGVHRLWAELREELPGFEFVHGNGLGVLGVGEDLPAGLAALFEADADAALAAEIRGVYARLGEAVKLEVDRMGEQERAEVAVEPVRSQLEAMRAALEAMRAELTDAETQLAAERELRKAARGELDARKRERDVALAVSHARIDHLQLELDAMHASTSWRLGAPVRFAGVRAHAVRERNRQRKRRRRTKPATDNDHDGAGSSPDGRIRVAFLSGEAHTPGHRYRVINVATALAPRRFDVTVIPLPELPARLGEIDAVDVLWVWRTPWSSPHVPEAIAAAGRAGARVVNDLDDLMFRPDLARAEVIDGIRTHRFSEREVANLFADIQRTLLQSDHATAPTAALARQMRRLAKPTTVVPNGFDSALLRTSRKAKRVREAAPDDGIVRIGYASGSFTHQHDVAVAASAIARVLAERPDTRFVSFEGALDPDEFPELRAVASQIELRPLVPLDQLPDEYARFDVNIAPLEVGNPFCEAKSELKYFEAALAGTPTVASPTEPLAAAIRHGETGLLATDEQSWYDSLWSLVGDADLRRRIADAAYHDVLWRFGPERRGLVATRTIDSLVAPAPVLASVSRTQLADYVDARPPAVELSEFDVLFESPRRGESRLAIVMPLFNYAQYVEGALDSLRRQTSTEFDVIVVDDRSTDDSPAVAQAWLERHARRFNRVALLRNRQNSQLARTRNAAVTFADTELYFPLDPDNELLPACVESALALLDETGAAFAFPTVELFGDGAGTAQQYEWDPALLRSGNYIDAMALVRRACWVAVGGYTPMDPPGWEDFDLWCKFVERGFFGVRVPRTTARYRVHASSMLSTTTDRPNEKNRLVEEIMRRHPWLDLVLEGPLPRVKMNRGSE